MTAIVLAGGKSLRLGEDKTSMMIGDVRLIQRVINRVSSICDEIIVVTSEEKKELALFSELPVKVVADIYPGKGSLGGIYTGLRASGSTCNLVVACDMPFLNLALLRYLVSLAVKVDIVIPRIGDLLEPLHAIYSKDCLAHMERALRDRRLRVSTLFDQVRVRYVEKDEVERFDPTHLSFFNINTRHDLRRAREIAAQRK